MNKDITAAAEPLIGPLVVDTWLKHGNGMFLIWPVYAACNGPRRSVAKFSPCASVDVVTHMSKPRVLTGAVPLSHSLQHDTDPTILMTVQEVLMRMADTSAIEPLLHRALAHIVTVLQAPPSSDVYGMQASAIDLLAALVRGCKSPLPQPLIDQVCINFASVQ